MHKNDYLRECRKIEEIRKRIEKSSILLEGKLHAEMTHGKYPQYYLDENTKKDGYARGRYLRKDEIGIAREYAQAEYNQKLLKELDILERELNVAVKLCDSGIYKSILNVYDRLPEAKKRIVNSVVLSDADYLEEWYKSFVVEVNSYPKEQGIITDRGEIVRSKSEKMIADKLYSRNIPYIYEPQIILNDKSILFPDFVTLNPRERKNIYIEHFGMMDNPEYCKGALEKIERYELNGLYLGENLLTLFESSQKSINTKILDRMIERYLQ